MIDLADYTVVGTIGKTHGVSGELTLNLAAEVDLGEDDFVIMEMDGLPTPFYIASMRPKGNNALVQFDGITSESLARTFFGKKVYAPHESVTDESNNPCTIVGYTIYDEAQGVVGPIDAVNDMTANLLFVVGDQLIPACEEFIVAIDQKNRIVRMRLPEGLLDMNGENGD